MTRNKKRCMRGTAASGRRRHVTNTTCSLTRNTPSTQHLTARYGSVAGAVLRSARRSAHISQARLAAACGAIEKTVRAWESGSSPLATVPMPQIAALIDALLDAGACRPLTADLTVASWCDLVITAIGAGEDTTCLLADPITADGAFGELMTWCLEGRVPQRYLPYAITGPLVHDQTLIERIRRALD
jgi:DNA-binding transcriptional regulator YiaG